MDPTGEEHSKKFGRKLTKLRKPTRHASVQYPERLQPGDDAQEDVTAPKGKMPTYMNQSVFGMIAAAGSKSDFHARFDDDSSGSSDDEEDNQKLPVADAQEARRTSKAVAEEQTQTQERSGRPSTNSQKGFNMRLRRSLPKLHLRTSKEKRYMSQSSILPSVGSESSKRAPNVATPRDAPLMSRMLEAQAQMISSTADLKATAGVPETSMIGSLKESDGTTTLVTRLMEIFGFAKPEEVISGVWAIGCWLPWMLMLWQSIPAGSCKVFFSRVTCTLQSIISASTHIYQRNL